MEMNSEIIPSTEIAPYRGSFCGHCDLEFEHAGECEWDADDCGDCGDCESCEESRHEFYEDDMWADSQALASAGWGTDEDYGFYGDY